MRIYHICVAFIFIISLNTVVYYLLSNKQLLYICSFLLNILNLVRNFVL